MARQVCPCVSADVTFVRVLHSLEVASGYQEMAAYCAP